MNPATQGYDYQNGRGLDSFMTAAIDSVSWETSLSSTFNTLSQAPVGQSAYGASTAINYDQSQISGSQGGTTTLGGSGGAAAGTGGSGNLQIDPTNSQIRLSDGTVNRLLIGLGANGKYKVEISNPGYATGTNHANFDSESIIGIQDFPSILLVDPGGGIRHDYQFVIPHNLGFIPDYSVVALIPNPDYTYTSMFPSLYYVPLTIAQTLVDSQSLIYTYVSGIDTQNLYLALSIFNQEGLSLNSFDLTMQYFISRTRAA